MNVRNVISYLKENKLMLTIFCLSLVPVVFILGMLTYQLYFVL
jgi:hypothetical protein